MVDVIFINHGRSTDEASGNEAIRSQFQPLFDGAAKLNLDVGDILEERVKVYEKLCSAEECYLVVWTTPAVLDIDEWKRNLEKQRLANKGLPYSSRAQNYMAAAACLEDIHSSFISSIQNSMKLGAIIIETLDAHEQIRVMRSQIDPALTPGDWRPVLPGDDVSISVDSLNRGDPGDLLWPRLADQLFPRAPVVHDMKSVQIGDLRWGGVQVTIPPKRVMPFQVLFNTLRGPGIPYRLLIRLSGGGLRATSFNASMASALTLGSAKNKVIDRAFKNLKDRYDNGETICSMQMIASTWAPANQEERIAENISRLARGLQSWGGCDITERIGNPLNAALSTVPGLFATISAPVCAAPLSEVLPMLPWQRAASPWAQGNLILRQDSKPFPFASFSKKQDAWVNLIFAPMGAGKSVLMNCLNLGLVCDPGNEDLPLIRILDIGISSSGLTSLLQYALPPSQAHRAQYHRIRNTDEYRWNPFDLLLGMDEPLPPHLDFLVSLLTILSSPLGNERPEDGVDGLARFAIQNTYKRLRNSKDSSPNLYSPSTDLIIDRAIENFNLHIDRSTNWWEIRDQLMERGETRLAARAQRYAVPNLTDLLSEIDSRASRQIYKGSTRSNEPIVDYMTRKIKEAMNSYQILTGPTVFDLEEAAVVAIDLDEVAPKGGDQAKRQTTVMYMLSLWMLSSDFFIGEETLKSIPPAYLEYHRARIRRLTRAKRSLCADELHRATDSAPIVIDTIRQIIREGRKWQIGVTLASQNWEDFPKTIIDLSSTVWVMKPPQGGAADLCKQFNFNETEKIIIENRLLGSRPGEGANVVARFLTKEMNFSLLLTNTCGGIELWAFSTTAEDRIIRNVLSKEFNPRIAREALAKAYPGGSCGSEIERRLALRVINKDQSSGSVVDEIIGEVRAQIKKSLK